MLQYVQHTEKCNKTNNKNFKSEKSNHNLTQSDNALAIKGGFNPINTKIQKKDFHLKGWAFTLLYLFIWFENPFLTVTKDVALQFLEIKLSLSGIEQTVYIEIHNMICVYRA